MYVYIYIYYIYITYILHIYIHIDGLNMKLERLGEKKKAHTEKKTGHLKINHPIVGTPACGGSNLASCKLCNCLCESDCSKPG